MTEKESGTANFMLDSGLKEIWHASEKCTMGVS